MKSISFSFQGTVFLLSLAAITSGISGLTAQAETINNSIVDRQQTITQSNNLQKSENLIHPASQTELTEEEPSTTPKAVAVLENEGQSEVLEKLAEIKTEPPAESFPVPGTNKTSASALANELAQFENVEPGRATRTGSSYLGIGGNVGITGDQALGDFGFALFAKIGLTRDFSVRPTFVFADDFDFLLPLTYDFRLENSILYPFLGGGLLVTTGDGNVGGLITAGVDFPLSSLFTATGRFNFGFTGDDVSIGFIFGLGYNFGAGFRF